MLDLKRIRTNLEEVKTALGKRKGAYPLDEVLSLDEKRRNLLMQMEDKKANQNRVSKEIPLKKKAGEDVTAIFAEMKALGEEVKVMEGELRDIEQSLNQLLLTIPNTPNPLVPEGADDTENEEIRRYLEPTQFPYEPKAHWDIGTDLGILEWERAGKITGARFTLFKGEGARLERAIINFMLNLHTGEHDYMEVSPPFMVNRQSMTGTGQLPKFEEDMFHIPDKDFFLIPTAEVPVTNLLRDEIVEASTLPVKLTAYTPCFRKEAGSAGRDTRGVIRNHQFDKVELVKFAHPDHSYDELESLTANAEEVLKRLHIPYRVVRLCTGDLGFSSAMTYDIEVWMPSYNRYVEISSCSNFEDFQARRANIRFRDENDKRTRFVHTLNGSGLAVGRTLAAILENFQQEDGSVLIPEVLRPFMGGQTHICKEDLLH